MSSTQQLLLGEGAGGGPANYIEDVFSTYLYIATQATLAINNGIDLSTKGGLVLTKCRSDGGSVTTWTDTVRGATNWLASSTASQQNTTANTLTAFNSNGFTLGADTTGNFNYIYRTNTTYVSWSFRKQPKFFDIVTWTGNGTVRTIPHNLGSAPGCIMVKSYSSTSYGSTDWITYHRSLGATKKINLNSTGAASTSSAFWNNTAPTSTVFTVGTDSDVNGASDTTYVAYLFAHDAGGFGLTGTDNVISCGSYVGNGLTAGPQVTLGWEPQWVLRKNTTAARGGPGTAGSWSLVDNMRGLSQTICPFLFANESAAEDATTVTTGYIIPNATGFVDTYTSSGDTYIYIAIRRGPMKVPTSATTVFTPLALNNATGTVNTTGFPIDLQMQFYRSGGIGASNSQWVDRLRGFSSTSTQTGPRLYTPSDSAENDTALGTFFSNTGFSTSGNWASIPMVYWNWRRAPGFFDEVCYTGTGSARTITHNLTVAPQLLFVKSRSNVQNWSALCTLNSGLQGNLNTTGTLGTPSAAVWGSGGVYVAPTASVFTVGTDNETNASGWTYVAYLFATCAGVSKVGSYIGNATLSTIDCGFTGGARWVLIKRTNSALSWHVWDTARGMVSGTDPSVQLNFTSGDVSGNSVFTVSTGFQIVASPFVDINVIGDTYIFLAIA